MATASQIIGKSQHAEALRKALQTLGGHRRPCLIVGEPGVGKTTFALELGKRDAAYEIISIAHLSESELESRLAGLTTGTVVLEHLESSSFRQQERVLGFIDGRPQEVRLIVTLSDRLEELHDQHRLLDDLYSKVLSFETIEILPLRERPEDIPLLLRHFAPGFVVDVNGLEVLIRRLWHGNVTELRTIAERCQNASPDGVFRLPAELIDERPEVVRVLSGFLKKREQALDRSLDSMEKGIIQRALRRFGFDLALAAEFLGMKKEDLEQKVERLGLTLARHT